MSPAEQTSNRREAVNVSRELELEQYLPTLSSALSNIENVPDVDSIRSKLNSLIRREDPNSPLNRYIAEGSARDFQRSIREGVVLLLRQIQAQLGSPGTNVQRSKLKQLGTYLDTFLKFDSLVDRPDDLKNLLDAQSTQLKESEDPFAKQLLSHLDQIQQRLVPGSDFVYSAQAPVALMTSQRILNESEAQKASPSGGARLTEQVSQPPPGARIRLPLRRVKFQPEIPVDVNRIYSVLSKDIPQELSAEDKARRIQQNADSEKTRLLGIIQEQIRSRGYIQSQDLSELVLVSVISENLKNDPGKGLSIDWIQQRLGDISQGDFQLTEDEQQQLLQKYVSSLPPEAIAVYEKDTLQAQFERMDPLQKYALFLGVPLLLVSVFSIMFGGPEILSILALAGATIAGLALAKPDYVREQARKLGLTVPERPDYERNPEIVDVEIQGPLSSIPKPVLARVGRVPQMPTISAATYEKLRNEIDWDLINQVKNINPTKFTSTIKDLAHIWNRLLPEDKRACLNLIGLHDVSASNLRVAGPAPDRAGAAAWLISKALLSNARITPLEQKKRAVFNSILSDINSYAPNLLPERVKSMSEEEKLRLIESMFKYMIGGFWLES